jgi:hypothetical protein
MRYAIQNLEVGDSVPEPIDVERTKILERADVLDDDDEPPPLPPPPARGSSNYVAVALSEPVYTRVIMPRSRLGSCGPEDGPAPRRSQRDTLVDDEAIYQALLRQLRS